MGKRLQAGKHGCYGSIHLAEGETLHENFQEVPVMLVYVGEFDSMDGPVQITPEIINLLVENHNSMLARVKRLATGDVPMKEYPPLQLDHSTSATMTVGRLIGNIYSQEVEIDGEKKLALMGLAKVLGKENVEKVRDGRWTHVSIGADLESGKINELSITPFPAAPKASILKRLGTYRGIVYEVKRSESGEGYDIIVDGHKVLTHQGSEDDVKSEAEKYIDSLNGHKFSKGDSMHEKMKKHLMESRKMSAEEAEKMSKKMMDYAMKKMGMDEEKMSKHLEKADDKEMAKMAAEHDEDEKKMAAEEDEKAKKMAAEEEEEKNKKMSASQNFKRLALAVRKGSDELGVKLKRASIGAKFTKLMASGKMTPAEVKKMDLSKMASLSQEALEAALSTFDAREPMVRFGSMTGSTRAEAVAKIEKKYRLARMELESRLNMPSKREEAKARLARLGEEEKKEKMEAGEEEAPSKGMLHKMTHEKLCEMVDNKAMHEELKACLKHLVDGYSQMEAMDGDDAQMSSIAKEQTKLQNQFNELVTLAAPALDIKPEELK